MTGSRPHRSRSLVSALVAAACVTATVKVEAGTEVHVVGEALVGWTDNAQSSPDEPVPGVPEKAADELVVLSPGIVLMRGTRGTIQRFGFTTSVTLYWHERDADTWSNRLEYQGLFDLDPRTTLLFGQSATATRAWTATVLTPAGAGELGATLQGTGTMLTLTTDEVLSHDLSESLRGWQSMRFSYGTPVDDETRPYSTDTLLGVGMERSFRFDALGAELRAEYGTVSPGDIRQLASTAVAIWRHDYGRNFSSRLEAGVMRVDRLVSGRHFWHPSALASVFYTDDWGSAELSYAHRATTSVALGQTLLIDEVRLAGGVPLVGERTLVVAGSAGYQRGRVIEDDASQGARLDITLADLGLAWQVAPALALGLRYQYARQISDGTAPPDPLSYQRNTVLAGATIYIPPETELRRPLRQPTRVDRSDDLRGRRSRDQQRGMD